MAERPVFRAEVVPPYVQRCLTQFEFFGGFSLVQKRRCIESLQGAYLKGHPDDAVLEVSSKSKDVLGVSCSAFNLMLEADGLRFSVECAFQASKVFEGGGPYRDLLHVDSRSAKKDPRLRESGAVIGFDYLGDSYPTRPLDSFYNWLYLNALSAHPALADALEKFDAFTDIEFNPKRSINCQAAAAAIYVGLERSGSLVNALRDYASFVETVYGTREKDVSAQQGTLF